MAGTTLDRKLTARRAARASFALATRADDSDIRCLLRENPMRGRISLTLEREPDYFADADLPGIEKHTIIANERDRIVCIGSCVIQKRFVNGTPCRTGYLGGLRLDAGAAGRFDILRRGYEFFRELQADDPADFYFTSIASDNVPARRFLERGLRGMPTYEFVGEFVTVLLAARRGSPSCPVLESGIPSADDLLDFLDRHGRNYQFATSWSALEVAAFSKLGLQMKNFVCEREGGGISAVAAFWDQRAFRQTVIRDYDPWLKMARPAVNFAARILGTPGLPAVGTPLAHAFISPLAVDAEKPKVPVSLVAKLREVARETGIEFLTLGLAANDPRLSMFRRQFGGREYRSRIYVVRWPGLGGSAGELDGRCLGPEVALL